MKFILILAFTVMSGVSCAAIEKRPLELSVPSATYETAKPVPLSFKNVGESRIRVYSYGEVMEKGKWITWPFRVEDGRLSAISNLYPLNPGDSKTIEFDVRKSATPVIPTGAKPKAISELTFRFRIVSVADQTDEVLSEQLSKPFVVRDPFMQSN